MKTVVVIYTNDSTSPVNELRGKRYAFNMKTKEAKVGKMLYTKAYGTPMRIVKVLDRAYDYVNIATGEFSNEYTSTMQYDIRTLEHRKADVVAYSDKPW